MSGLQGKSRREIAQEFYTGYQDTKSLEHFEQMIFKRSRGLRLTHYGFRTISKKYTPYSFTSKTVFLPRELIAIAREIEGPYYISSTFSNIIKLFDESDAIMINLSGGITQFLKKFSIR